jgi:hypothetical protein
MDCHRIALTNQEDQWSKEKSDDLLGDIMSRTRGLASETKRRASRDAQLALENGEISLAEFVEFKNTTLSYLGETVGLVDGQIANETTGPAGGHLVFTLLPVG